MLSGLAVLSAAGLLSACSAGAPETSTDQLLLTADEAPVDQLVIAEAEEWTALRDKTATDFEGVRVEPPECTQYNSDLALVDATDAELAARATAVGGLQDVQFILYITPHTGRIAQQSDAVDDCEEVTMATDDEQNDFSAQVTFQEIAAEEPDGVDDYSALRRHVIASRGDQSLDETAVLYSGVVRDIGVEALAFRGEGVDPETFDAALAEVFDAQVAKIDAAD